MDGGGDDGGSLRGPTFGVVLRGYERRQVDKHIERVLKARLEGRPLPAGAARPGFTIVLRGYDCAEVDEYLRQVSAGPEAPPSDR